LASFAHPDGLPAVSSDRRHQRRHDQAQHLGDVLQHDGQAENLQNLRFGKNLHDECGFLQRSGKRKSVFFSQAKAFC